MPTIDDYRNKFPSLKALDDSALIDRVAEVQGVSRDDVMAHMGYKPKARGMLSALNDTVIEGANAVAGGVKSVGDFVAPGNPVSEFIDTNIIKAGEASQSDVVKAEKARYRDEMEGAQGIGDEVGATLGYVARNPLQSLAQAAGSFVLPGAAVKGGGMLASMAGAGAKGATRAGLAGGAVAGAALSGGDAAGTAYELVKKAGGTDEQAAEAARKASVLPAAIGAAGGVVGAERLLAGAKGFGGNAASRALKTAGVEGAQEAIEEGVTQYEGQAAAVPFDPTIDPTKGVAGAATMGAVLGGATGGAVSLLSGKPGQPKPDPVVSVLAAPSVDDAINAAKEAVGAKPAQRAQAPAELPQMDPDDRREVLGLLQVVNRPGVSPNVARFAQSRMDALLAPYRTIPAGEATEMLPVPDARELTDEERAEYVNAVPFSYRWAVQRGLPQPEVTELLPTGDATEVEPIPAADAFEELPAPEAYEVAPVGEASELLPTPDVAEYDQVPAGEASELDAETIQMDDLLARDGEPFTSKTGAQAKAYASGGGRVVAIPDHFGSGIPGYVVRPLVQARPNNTRGTDARDLPRSSNDDQRDLAGSAEQVPGASDGRGADAARSGGVVGLVPDAPGRVDQPAEAPSASNRPADVVAGAGDADTALTPGSRVTLNGTPYTVTAANSTAVKLQGADGGVKMVARNSKTFQAIQQEPNEAARPQPQAAGAEAAAPAAAPAGATAAEAVVSGSTTGTVEADGVGDGADPFTLDKRSKRYMKATGKPSIPPAGTGFVAMYPDGAAVEADGLKPAVRMFGSSGYQLTMAQALAKVKELEADARKRKAAATKAPTAFMRDMDEKAASSSATLARKLREDIKQAVNSYPDARAEYAEAQGGVTQPSGEAAPAPAPEAAPAAAPAPAPERTPKAQAVKEALAPDLTTRKGMVKALKKLGYEATDLDAARTRIPNWGRVGVKLNTIPFKLDMVVELKNERWQFSALESEDPQSISQQEEIAKFKADFAKLTEPPKRAAQTFAPPPANVSNPAADLDTSAGRVQNAAVSEPVATHKDPGEPAEPVTPAVVREAIKTGVQATDRKPSAMKAELLAKIDAAIADAPDEVLPVWKQPTKDQIRAAMVGMKLTNMDRAEQALRTAHDNRVAEASRRIGHVNFSVEGDGQFKVLNSKPYLEEFRRKVAAPPGFKAQRPGPLEGPRDGGENGSGGKVAAFDNMVNEGDLEAASDYADAVGLELDPKKLANATKVLKWRETRPAPATEAAVQPEAEAPAPAAAPAEQAAAILNAAAEPPKGKERLDVLKDVKAGAITPEEVAAAYPPSGAQETTDAQRQQSEDHAKDLGGRVVWQRGDLALIEGYSLLSGDSVYIAANGSQRTRVDIQSYTGKGYTEAQKAELMKARADAVRAADELLTRNPDGPFADEPLVFADDIPAAVQGVVRGWIGLLGLDGARIVVTTPASGAAMADGMAGKFRRIGKARLSGDNTNGTMQPLGGDDFHIAVRPGVSTLKALEVMAHELGHIVERRAFAQASAGTQQAIRDAHAAWLKENGSGRALDMAQAMRAYRSGQTTGFSEDAKALEAGAYWRSFGEWFADQVSRWATTEARPVGVVEQFFKRLADRLRGFFTGERAKFKPNTTVAQWLDSLAKDVPPAEEVAAAYPAAEPAEPTKINDAGEKIGGARKDLWKERGLSVADLDAMSESEGATLATKANVWKPDYAAIAEASEPVTAAMVKVVYDQLAAQPKKDTPEGRRDYVKAMQAVRKVYGAVTTPDQAKNAYQAMREEIGLRVRFSDGPGFREATGQAATDAKRVLFSVYKGRSDPFVFGYNELARARKLVQEGFPGAVEPWTRRYVVRPFGGAGTTAQGLTIYVDRTAEAGTPLTREQIAAGAFEVRSKTGGPVAYAVTKADAEAAAKAVYERTKGSADAKEEPDRPHLDKVARENLPQRIDREVTPELLLQEFGFRAVEFGNWAAQDERRKVLALAYDALADLATIVGAPNRALSLNGTMGLAFGARGGGKFAAHYEPGKLVINMTKLRGAGSLAHEWAHALDHYLGELDRADAYKGKARGASGWYSQDSYTGQPRNRMVQGADGKWTPTTEYRMANLRPELAAQVDAVMKRLYETPIPQDEALAIARKTVADYRAMAERDQDPRMKAMYAEGADKAQRIVNDLESGKPSDRTKRSSFAVEAQRLSGKKLDGYWVRPTEMLARAFESYVFDRLMGMGAKSEYLVHGVEQDRYSNGTRYKGNPYPTGAERAAINDEFAKLFDTLKTRADDAGNVALFSRAPGRSVELEAADAVGREFWRKIDNGESFTDQEVLDALSINRRGSRRLARGMRSIADQAGTGTAAVGWEGDLASFGPYTSRASWDGDNFNVFFIPDSLAGSADLNDDAQARDKALVHVSFKSAPGGSYELSLNDPQPGSTALAAVEAAGISAQVGVESKRYTQIALRAGDVTSRMVLQEAARRLALNIGRTPDVMYAGRDTGAKTGKNTGPVEYSADTLRDKFSRTPGSRTGVPMADAKAVVATIREALPTAPEIVLHDSVRRAPENLRRLIRQAGADNDVEAVYHDGEIHVFPGNISSIERMQFVVAHHEVRHHGLRSMLGPQMGPAMLRMYASNPNLKAAADQKMADGLADTRILAVEEALADMPVEELRALTGWARIVAAARQWLRQAAAKLRRAGLNTLADAMEPEGWTDNDIAALVQRAEDVSRGGAAPFRTGGTVFGREDNPDWYSALADQVGKASMNAGPASAWKAMLKNWTTTGKVKADEVEWSGLNEWLDMTPGKITKAQVADYLRANGVQVTETVLGGETAPAPDQWWVVDTYGNDSGPFDSEEDAEAERLRQVQELIDQGAGETWAENEAVQLERREADQAEAATKYGQYTLPGGTNYREVLLTLPEKAMKVEATKEQRAYFDFIEKLQAEHGNEWRSRAPIDDRLEAARLERAAKDSIQRDAANPNGIATPRQDRANYRSGHWDQPNIVAHIRVNDRVGADGSRVLFVEELQSDYAQDARKKGVQKKPETVESLDDPRVRLERRFEGGKELTDVYLDGENVQTWKGSIPADYILADLNEVIEKRAKKGVPAAPYIDATDKWVALAMKRVIKMAVDGGYDKVAFVTGEQSADRYDLSKQVEELMIERDGDNFSIAMKPLGQGYSAGSRWSGKAAELPDVVGKELVDKVAAQPEGRSYMRGVDLRVGGEGMRAFYNKIVPSVAKDVLRKLGGGAMEPVQIGEPEWGVFNADGDPLETGFSTRAKAEQVAKDYDGASVRNEGGDAQPGFTITQAMRDKALGGMPLFSRADQTQTPDTRPQAVRAVQTMPRSPLTGRPVFDLMDAAGNRIETQHHAKTADEALENYRERPARQDAARAAAPAPTYAMPEKAAKAEGSNWRRVRGQEFTSLDEDDGYLYHVTSAPAAAGVREQGLVPNAGGMFGGFYANYSAGKVFLTERSGVSYWQEKVGQQLEAAMENPPAVTVLRIPKDKIKAKLLPDTVGSGDARAPAFYSNEAVFSRSAGTAKTTAQDLVNSTGGVFDFNRLGETKQDRLRTIMDAGRPGWLGLLTRDQIADVYGKEISPVKEYDELTRAMENQRSKIAQDADDLYNEWAKLPAETNDKLARLMLDATVYSVHPDAPFAKLDRPDDAERQKVHVRLKAQYALMGKEGQAVYAKVRDFHKGTLEQLRDALEARVTRQVENGQAKAAALTKIRQAFDAYLKEGPYFPLSRFGDFIVVGNRESDGERVVASYATAGEQAAAARTLEADGFTVKMKTAKTYSRETDGSAGKFIGDVLTTIGNLDMLDATVGGDVADLKTKLMDDVNQLFIKALPDLSYRKHFMHRKGTPGFSSDMMRGFASSAFHAASHIARLNHGDRMTFALQDAFTAIEQAPAGDFNLHSQVLNELTKRHDAALNPNTHPVAAMLNQVGFVMYLGLSPAAGLINMLQTVMVTMPHLGARYGFGKANASLATALTDITTGAKANAKNGWNAAQSTKLTGAERTMMSELQDEGVIDLTQAHDLSAATGLDTGNVARSKAAFAMARAMKIVGWTFHIPEVMNRQVTALSAYRLEMEKTGDAEKAKDAARESIKRTHFDYSSSNRARFMQGNVARVLLQFKQYSQNMTYLLGRAAYQALKGESPEVRSIARRQLVATFAVTWGMAGALGLPGLGAVAGLIGLLVGAMDDDDEPWDWKVEFRNLMADTFGKEAGEVLSHGIPRALMPWDISNRVSLGDLWFRDSGREGQSPREAFATDAANILGPTAGTVLGLYTAADHMARGNWSKAAESVVPKFLRDPLKAIREGSDGVTSYNGEPLMDLTGAEVTGRLLGFAPARASEMYEGKAAVMNAKTAIEEKRQSLISRMAKARIDKDTDTAAELQPEIAAFNQRNPEFKITGATLAKAIMTRMKNRANTEDGILLPRTKQSLRELGRFAEVE